MFSAMWPLFFPSAAALYCHGEEWNFILSHFDTEVKFSRKSHGNLNGRSDFSAF